MFERVSNSPANPLAIAILNSDKTGLWIISGASGAGKTTWCLDLAARARQANLTVGGLLCPAVFENGVKTGIDQVDLSSGEQRRLGTCVFSEDRQTIGCWQMDESVIAWGNEILRAFKDEDLIIIDELGPLELELGQGYQNALVVLDHNLYRTAVVVVRPALLASVQDRWPHARIHVLESVTR